MKALHTQYCAYMYKIGERYVHPHEAAQKAKTVRV